MRNQITTSLTNGKFDAVLYPQVFFAVRPSVLSLVNDKQERKLQREGGITEADTYQVFLVDSLAARLLAAQLGLVVWRLRPKASASAGTSSVMQLPAAM
jgi:hypothetical protein